MNRPPPPGPCSSIDSQRDFTATHWTQIALAAQRDGSTAAYQALESMCHRYWPAIYHYLRRKNHTPEDASDITQGFFGHILEANTIARADRVRGRFRNFLLGALQRFLVDESRRNQAQKRGRDKVVRVLDFTAVEKSYLEESDPGLSPEELYDRRWATTVLETAFKELQMEFQEARQAERFNELKRFLSEEARDGDYDRCAASLGITPKSISSAVCRLRERYRELVRAAVLTSVSDPGEIDPEFHELFR